MFIAQQLKKPYPLSSLKDSFVTSFFIGLFVSVFLYAFKPFGLDHPMPNKVWIILGYGLVTFSCLSAILVLSRILLPKLFIEEHWSIAKELLLVSLAIFSIATVNFLYSNSLGFFGFSWIALGYTYGITLMVGVFPFSAVVLLSYIRLLRRYQKGAIQINQEIAHKPEPAEPESEKISIKDYEGRVVLTLSATELVCAKAADNYVELHYLQTQPKQLLVRLSMARLAEQLAESKSFYRCHRSFIVNLEHVDQVSGNSQGLRLGIANSPIEVPVSRNKTKELKQKLSA